MSISRVGTATASATTVTPPAHQAGDIIVIWAMRGSSTTAPTVPAGYLPIFSKSNSTATTLVAIGGYKVASGTSDTSGTWTNASELICAVYRPSIGNTIRIGQGGTNSSTTATVNFPALTMADSVSGNSWIVGLVAASNITQTLTVAPSGMTNQASVVGASFSAALHDTNGGVSSWASTNANVVGAGNTVSATLELVLAPGPNAVISNVYHHIGGGANFTAEGQSGNAYKCPNLNPSGAGNTIMFGFTTDGGSTVSSVNGSVNGAYTLIKSALGGTGNLDTYVYGFQNCAAGTETITVTFSGNTTCFGYVISELYGVAKTGGFGGSVSTALNTTPATGSFTPTNNNANGGNFIWAFFCKADQDPNHWTSGLYPGGNFTLISPDISAGGGNPLNTGGSAASMPRVVEGFIQATSAAINPSITSVNETSGDNWNSIAVAIPLLPGAGSGAASGIFIHNIQHFTTQYFPSAGTSCYAIQCAATGNLRVIQTPDPNDIAVTVTDSEGNTWDSTASTAGIFFLANASANPNLTVFITGGGGDPNVSWRFIDISGAAPAPFDSFVVSAQTISSVSTFTASPAPSPSNANGIVIAALGLGQGPGLAVTSPIGAIWDFCTYTGETDLDTIENADILAHFYNFASGPITFTFTITSNVGNETSGGFIAFKAGSGFQALADVPGPPARLKGMRIGTPMSRLRGKLGYTNAPSTSTSMVGFSGSTGALSLQPNISLVGVSGSVGATSLQPTIQMVGIAGSIGATSLQPRIQAVGVSGSIGAGGLQPGIQLIGLSGSIGATALQPTIQMVGVSGSIGVVDPSASTGVLGMVGISGSIGLANVSVFTAGAISLVGISGSVGVMSMQPQIGLVGVAGSIGIVSVQPAIQLTGLSGSTGAASLQPSIQLVGISGSIGRADPSASVGIIQAIGISGSIGQIDLEPTNTFIQLVGISGSIGAINLTTGAVVTGTTPVVYFVGNVGTLLGR